MSNLVLYGGAFDPIHSGHLNTAFAVQNYFHFERFIFLPCKMPILKEATKASAEQRVQMLEIALKDYPFYEIDKREIKRESQSFMVNTLQSYRNELGNIQSITLLIGMDAFLQLPKWHSWPDIIKLANLLVIKRVGFNEKNKNKALKSLLLNHETDNANLLKESPAGKIYRYDAGAYDISSTKIREQINKGNNIDTNLPEKVYQFIKEQGLYQ